MKMFFNKILIVFMIIFISILTVSCTSGNLDLEDNAGREDNIGIEDTEEDGINKVQIEEDGYYTSKEDVALYIYTFSKLPNNYISKNEAKKRGWESNKGNLWEVTDKMSIGGDKFGNREGILEKKDGRQYFECDIDYKGGRRGAKRLVYSNDGLIYYTEDHYDSFTLLYGGE